MRRLEDIDDLLAGYALGAISEEDRRHVDRAAADDPSIEGALVEYLSTAATLSAGLLSGGEQPPLGLWDRIATEVAIGTDLAPVVPLRRANRLLTAVSVAALAATVLLSVQVLRQRSEISDLREQPLAAAVEDARRSGASTVALTGEVEAQVVLAADGTGYLIGDALPALDAGQTYQLWAVVEGRVVSAGVMGPDPDLAVFHVDGAVELFALTIEVAGGVVVSESGAVSTGEVDT